jgi:hypothetical protein
MKEFFVRLCNGRPISPALKHNVGFLRIMLGGAFLVVIFSLWIFYWNFIGELSTDGFVNAWDSRKYFCLTGACADNFFKLYSIPIKIAASTLAFLALWGIMIRSDEANRQIVSRNYFDHRKDFSEYFSKRSSVFFHKMDNPYLIYKTAFPKNNPSAVYFDFKSEYLLPGKSMICHVNAKISSINIRIYDGKNDNFS